jgi:hypothetical protein
MSIRLFQLTEGIFQASPTGVFKYKKELGVLVCA